MLIILTLRYSSVCPGNSFSLFHLPCIFISVLNVFLSSYEMYSVCHLALLSLSLGGILNSECLLSSVFAKNLAALTLVECSNQAPSMYDT